MDGRYRNDFSLLQYYFSGVFFSFFFACRDLGKTSSGISGTGAFEAVERDPTNLVGLGAVSAMQSTKGCFHPRIARIRDIVWSDELISSSCSTSSVRETDLLLKPQSISTFVLPSYLAQPHRATVALRENYHRSVSSCIWFLAPNRPSEKSLVGSQNS